MSTCRADTLNGRGPGVRGRKRKRGPHAFYRAYMISTAKTPSGRVEAANGIGRRGGYSVARMAKRPSSIGSKKLRYWYRMSADKMPQKTIIGQTRFLIIDSEATIAEALRRFLVSEGAPAAHVANSSLLALRVLQDRKTPVDCVICAHRVANSGLEFLMNLRSGRWGGGGMQYLSVILLMENHDEGVMAAADSAKVTGYIVGSLGKENVRQSIVAALDPRGVAQGLPNFKVAHVRASESDLIIALFPPSFGSLRVEPQQKAIQAVASAAQKRQLSGSVIAAYPGADGKAAFVAPAVYDRFLSRLTLESIDKMLNRAIHVEWAEFDPTAPVKEAEEDDAVEPLPLFDEDEAETSATEKEESSDRRRSAPRADASRARWLTDEDIRGVAKAFKEMGPQDFVGKFVRHQTVLVRGESQILMPSMREFYVSIDLLRKAFFPGVEMRGGTRAFQSLTHMLDQLMLRSLAFIPRDGLPCSLNLNVHSILTQTFDSALKSTSAENIIFEIPQPMITSYFEEFKRARDLIYARGGKIAVDQIFPDTMGALDLGLVGPNIAKVHWKGDLKNFQASHRDFVRKALDSGIEMVMSRVDDPAALDIAHEFGIRNVQGFLIEDMPEAKRRG
jgi:DNA-binding NarL/FixJ family response regulator/EAL domain-containing protein (putative c-di-GMP-specific phosphodiesterase class I)